MPNCAVSKTPLLYQAELSKFRLDRKLTCRRAVAVRVSMLSRVSFVEQERSTT